MLHDNIIIQVTPSRFSLVPTNTTTTTAITPIAGINPTRNNTSKKNIIHCIDTNNLDYKEDKIEKDDKIKKDGGKDQNHGSITMIPKKSSIALSIPTTSIIAFKPRGLVQKPKPKIQL